MHTAHASTNPARLPRRLFIVPAMHLAFNQFVPSLHTLQLEHFPGVFPHLL